MFLPVLPHYEFSLGTPFSLLKLSSAALVHLLVFVSIPPCLEVTSILTAYQITKSFPAGLCMCWCDIDFTAAGSGISSVPEI
jgi:hypothetical protein